MLIVLNSRFLGVILKVIVAEKTGMYFMQQKYDMCDMATVYKPTEFGQNWNLDRYVC